MRTLASMRAKLTIRLQELYLDPRGKSYYCMSNLDKKVDSPESRITNDVDLLCQFGFEFFFGGVLNPETGMVLQCFIFIGVCITSVVQTTQKTGRADLSAA